MHRGNPQLILLALYAPMLLSMGCRNPFADNQIQVQPGPTAFEAEVDAPRSRLGGIPGAGAQDTASPRGVSMSLGDGDSGVAQSLTPEEEQMLQEAYAKASPEMRDLARRQLAAMKRRNGAQTTANKPLGEKGADGLIDSTAAEEKLPMLADETATQQPSATEVQQASATASAKRETAAAETDPAKFTMPLAAAPEASASADAKAEEGSEAASEKPSDTAVAADPTPADNETTPSAQPPAEPPAEATAATATAATESESPSSGIDQMSDQQLLDELVARYQAKAEEADADVSTTVALRTLRLIAGDPDEAVKPVEDWKTSEQEFLNYQMLALWQLLDPKAHPVRERRWATALPELKQAVNHLAAATGALEVRNLAFCTSVQGYGQLEPFDSSRFTPGQQVLLYVEVEDFVAERLSDGYETHLQGTYEILDANGKRVAHQVLPPDRQTSNNYRRDYYIAYEMFLPQRLPAGNYRMQVTMEDVKGKTYGQSMIPLEIAE